MTSVSQAASLYHYIEAVRGSRDKAEKVSKDELLQGATWLGEQRVRALKRAVDAQKGSALDLDTLQLHITRQEKAWDLYESLRSRTACKTMTLAQFQSALTSIRFPAMIGADIITSLVIPGKPNIEKEDFETWSEKTPVQFRVAYNCSTGVLPDRTELEALLNELNTLTGTTVSVSQNGQTVQMVLPHSTLEANTLLIREKTGASENQMITFQGESISESKLEVFHGMEISVRSADSDDWNGTTGGGKLHAYAHVIRQQQEYLKEICEDGDEVVGQDAVVVEAMHMVELEPSPPEGFACFARRGTPGNYRYSSRRLQITSSHIVAYAGDTVTETLPLATVAYFSLFSDPDSQFCGASSPPGWSLLYIGSPTTPRVLAVPSVSVAPWTEFVKQRVVGVSTEPVEPPLPYPADSFVSSPKKKKK
eukprot:TRINITY_DN2555_c2_g1_i1.p1 TRINITY_DN2555_c2_g1~~TRINITY_DN2555_c2_g1_i1.p1  ORF type:complete len:449 (+),score=66.78 TRINITY_DN2555_c2_g1_i1:82-1347(+)